MIFVFDWGYRTENQIGPLSKKDAYFEIDTEFVWLTRVRFWFRLFFIPTIPTKTRYFLLSEADGSYHAISKEFFHKYRKLAALNRLLMDEKISDEAYWSRREEMNFD